MKLPYMMFINRKEFYPPTNNSGFIPSREEWESYRDLVDEFYKSDAAEVWNAEQNEYLTKLMKGEVSIHKSTEVEEKVGYVYFIKADTLGVKIGCTSNLESRVKALKVASPHELTLITSVKSSNYIELERQFHEWFKHKHIKGEWYDITDAEIGQALIVLSD